MTQASDKTFKGSWIAAAILLAPGIYNIVTGLANERIGILCTGLGYAALAFSLVYNDYRFSTSWPLMSPGRRGPLSIPLSLAVAILLIAGMILKRTQS